MSIEIIFVDGCVNSGKTTFINKLKNVFEMLSMGVQVHVIDEPIERGCTRDIVDDIGYPSLFNFIVSRKVSLLKNTVVKLCAESVYLSSLNVIIVERSLAGDRNVRGFYNECVAESTYNEILGRKYVNTQHILVRRPNIPATDESHRLTDHYSRMDDSRIITNREDGGYNLFIGAVSIAIDTWNCNAKKTH